MKTCGLWAKWGFEIIGLSSRAMCLAKKRTKAITNLARVTQVSANLRAQLLADTVKSWQRCTSYNRRPYTFSPQTFTILSTTLRVFCVCVALHLTDSTCRGCQTSQLVKKWFVPNNPIASEPEERTVVPQIHFWTTKHATCSSTEIRQKRNHFFSALQTDFRFQKICASQTTSLNICTAASSNN